MSKDDRLTVDQFAAVSYAFMALLSINPAFSDAQREEFNELLNSAPDSVILDGIRIALEPLPDVMSRLKY